MLVLLPVLLVVIIIIVVVVAVAVAVGVVGVVVVVVGCWLVGVGVGVGVVGVVVVATQLTFAFLCTPKNRQIGGVFAFFLTLAKQNALQIPMLYVPRKPKTTVFTTFFCLW